MPAYAGMTNFDTVSKGGEGGIFLPLWRDGICG